MIPLKQNNLVEHEKDDQVFSLIRSNTLYDLCCHPPCMKAIPIIFSDDKILKGLPPEMHKTGLKSHYSGISDIFVNFDLVG